MFTITVFSWPVVAAVAHDGRFTAYLRSLGEPGADGPGASRRHGGHWHDK